MKIYKYPIKIQDNQKVFSPRGANILYAGLDPSGAPCIWAEVDPSQSVIIPIEIFIVGTGFNIPQKKKYLNSFNQGAFAWHVYYE